MASTEQIRKWYHTSVVLNHDQRGTPGYQPNCNHRHQTMPFPKEGGGVFNEPVHPLTREAWRAYITVMIHHDETMPGAGGVDQCRNIAGTDWPSLHAYLCAVDLPPNSRKSSAFIGDIGRIRCNNGAFAFRNLAGDRMHDQINCSPADLATGIDWTTVAGATEDEVNALKLGDTGSGVSWFQTALNEKSAVNPKLGVNATFDVHTERAVKQYQGAAGFDQNGIIDGALASLIAKDHPKMTGEKGDKGEKGDQGSKGSTGLEGAQGIQGIQGKQGSPGSLTIQGAVELP